MDVQQLGRWWDVVVRSPYLGIAGLIVSILSLAYAVIVRIKSKNVKKLTCNLASTNIVKNSTTTYPKLSILYEGRPLQNLTVTNAMVKNAGTEVIRGSDIAGSDPLRLRVHNSESVTLLDAAVVSTSRSASNLQISKSDGTVSIEFEFLQPKDWGVIQLLHTGVGSEALTMSGTVIGAAKPFSPESPADQIPARGVVRLMTRFPRLTACVSLTLFGLSWIIFIWSLFENLWVRVIGSIPALSLLWSAIRIALRPPLEPQQVQWRYAAFRSMHTALLSHMEEEFQAQAEGLRKEADEGVESTLPK